MPSTLDGDVGVWPMPTLMTHKASHLAASLAPEGILPDPRERACGARGVGGARTKQVDGIDVLEAGA